MKSLDDEEPIGAGSYGIVRKVTRRADGKKFALKTIRKAPWRQPPTSRTSVQYYHSKLRNELEVMRTIGSSLSIVYLYDSFEDNDAVHLLMDLCEGGELLGGSEGGRTRRRTPPSSCDPSPHRRAVPQPRDHLPRHQAG